MNCVSESEIKIILTLMHGLLEYEEQCNSSISSRVLEITKEEHNDHITTSQFAMSGIRRGVLF